MTFIIVGILIPVALKVFFGLPQKVSSIEAKQQAILGSIQRIDNQQLERSIGRLEGKIDFIKVDVDKLCTRLDNLLMINRGSNNP